MESLRVNSNNRRENGWMDDGWVGGWVAGFLFVRECRLLTGKC